MSPSRPLPAAAARRIALAAQGFAEPRPTGRVDARHIRRVVDRLGLLQIDSVNVFSRAHYLPVLARLGPYPRATLDRMTAYTARPVVPELFEYWAHAACLVPVRLQPFLRWRMARADRDAWLGVRQAGTNDDLVTRMRKLVDDEGPISGGDTGIERPEPRAGSMWNWHEGKAALEYLFYAGEITTARRINFERFYDRTDRVLPAEVLARPTPEPADAHRELVRVSARALGVATVADLRDYFRLSHAATKLAVAELVEAGELTAIRVEGWKDSAYLWHEARRPRTVRARGLMAPFDPLIWFRERTERVFGFHYRIEIYTKQAQRRYGYYVLPFLLGDQLVGRVDLKSDRQNSVLRVQSAWLEPGRDGDEVAAELAAELALTAGWLELDRIEVMPRGDLAPALAAHVND